MLSAHNYSVVSPVNSLENFAHKEYKTITFNTKLFCYFITVTKTEK